MSPLRVDLVRHGEASPAAIGGDPARPLSPRGRADVTRLAARLRAENARWSHVFVSPLARARETAALLREAREGLPEPETVSWLLPDEEPDETLTEFAARRILDGHVLLVSHQPLMGRLASFLTGELVEFRPGSLHRIVFDSEPGRRLGHLTLSVHPGG